MIGEGVNLGPNILPEPHEVRMSNTKSKREKVFLSMD